MEDTLISVTTELRGAPTCSRIKIRIARKRKEMRGVGYIKGKSRRPRAGAAPRGKWSCNLSGSSAGDEGSRPSTS